MEFEWDSAKAAINLRKHGVRFEDAAQVFLGPNRIESFDDEGANDEDRWLTVGMVEPVLLVVACTVRGGGQRERGGEIIRIISARKADAHERKKYREIQA